MSTSRDITITVELDENQVPQTMSWSATDADEGGKVNAALLSLWDPSDASTLKIDLWTKEMTVEDMKFFFHQTFLTLADTFDRATGESNMAQDIREFTQYFGTRMGIIEPNGHDGSEQ